jgi:lipopolysaccharide transport system permease protein
LVIRDLKIKYRRSFLGYLWSVLNPLFMMLVMVAVFSKIFRFDVPNYPVYLISGQVLFSFMSESTNNAMNSIVGSAALLKKIYVPKYIFSFSKVLSSLLSLLFSLAALFLVMLFTKSPFYITLLLSPLVLLQLFIFSLGFGLFLAQINVFFRDIQYIYSVIITAWMYATPIFYPESILSGRIGYFIKTFNPMYHYISQFRSLVLYGEIPQINNIIAGTAIAVCFLILGTWIFAKRQDDFILYI